MRIAEAVAGMTVEEVAEAISMSKHASKVADPNALAAGLKSLAGE